MDILSFFFLHNNIVSCKIVLLSNMQTMDNLERLCLQYTLSPKQNISAPSPWNWDLGALIYMCCWRKYYELKNKNMSMS